MDAPNELLTCRCLQLTKAGNSDAECEDAAAWDCATGRFAIADGASESIFAGEWATLLCHSFKDDPPTDSLSSLWLLERQKQWRAQVGGRSDSWFLEQKIHDGAAATFLGLVIDVANAAWHAVAVGDSCLFQIRDDELLRAFPIERAGLFGSRPPLIGSTQAEKVEPLQHQGSLQQGDAFILATDAAAEWILNQVEAGRKPWRDLVELPDDLFPAWIDSLRTGKQIKNDDVTLLRVGYSNSAKQVPVA